MCFTFCFRGLALTGSERAVHLLCLGLGHNIVEQCLCVFLVEVSARPDVGRNDGLREVAHPIERKGSNERSIEREIGTGVGEGKVDWKI